jgi:tRNA threonylcarbamoyladenosine biosynthesis protein TsaE
VRVLLSPSLARWTSEGAEGTRSVGRRLLADLPADAVLLVSGELGSGKTVLAQGVAAGLGLDAREVVSPTYTLVREHGEGRSRLVHVDLYRLSSEEVEGLGLEELLAGPGVKFVEWPERLPFAVAGAFRVEVRRLPDGLPEAREIELWSTDSSANGESND